MHALLSISIACSALRSAPLTAQPISSKVTVALSVEADDNDLREAVRSALASELRQLGDVNVGEVESLGTKSGILLQAVAVGTLDGYSLWIEATPDPLILIMNAFYVGMYRDAKCIAKDQLVAHLNRINELLLNKRGGALYRGNGRDSLRKHCAAAVASVDNALLKQFRKTIGTEQ
jgi:hypothetical protein